MKKVFISIVLSLCAVITVLLLGTFIVDSIQYNYRKGVLEFEDLFLTLDPDFKDLYTIHNFTRDLTNNENIDYENDIRPILERTQYKPMSNFSGLLIGLIENRSNYIMSINLMRQKILPNFDISVVGLHDVVLNHKGNILCVARVIHVFNNYYLFCQESEGIDEEDVLYWDSYCCYKVLNEQEFSKIDQYKPEKFDYYNKHYPPWLFDLKHFWWDQLIVVVVFLANAIFIYSKIKTGKHKTRKA